MSSDLRKCVLTGKTLQNGAQEVGELGMKEGSRLILMGRKVMLNYFIVLLINILYAICSTTLSKKHLSRS